MGRRVSDDTRAKLDAIWSYAYDNRPVTVRGCCYHLFTKGLIPDMSKASTSAVSRILTRAREEGKINWDWFVDENREIEDPRGWTGLADFAKYVRKVYRKNPWVEQANHVELWTEKGTVRGLLSPVLQAYQLPLRVMHGYTSATCANDIATEIRECLYRDQKFIALYCGDWDPSGLDMNERDLPDRLERYVADGSTFELKRIALTRADVASGLPSFPLESKAGDTRFQWYKKTYHSSLCWELDAMNPKELRARLEAQLEALIDRDLWEETEAREAVEVKTLDEVLSRMAA